MSQRSLVVVVLATLGLWASSPAAAVETDSLVGTVLDAAGQPMPGVHLMVFEGNKIIPPFLIRPKAFGVPLPTVKVVETDVDGRFALRRLRPGRKTLLVGEEGLLLFGVAATRRLQPGAEDHVIRLSPEEHEAYLTLADRAERASEIVEEVLIEVDIAIGWYVEFRRGLEDVKQGVLSGFEDDEAEEEAELQDSPDEPEGLSASSTEEAPSLSVRFTRLRERLRRLVHGDGP
ncbi:carboxypeptidase-like regulatory domain-containing protein [Planctomycetota bacterium]